MRVGAVNCTGSKLGLLVLTHQHVDSVKRALEFVREGAVLNQRVVVKLHAPVLHQLDKLLHPACAHHPDVVSMYHP